MPISVAEVDPRARSLPAAAVHEPGRPPGVPNGIVGLTCSPRSCSWSFAATHAPDPLYMIGVFVSFTLSQAGMVVQWRRCKRPAGGRTRWSMRSARSSPAWSYRCETMTKAQRRVAHHPADPPPVVFFRATRRHTPRCRPNCHCRLDAQGVRNNTSSCRSAGFGVRWSAPWTTQTLSTTCAHVSMDSRDRAFEVRWQEWGGGAAGMTHPPLADGPLLSRRTI